MSVAAVVLAAGSSRRFVSGHKLAAPFRGKPLGIWAVEQAVAARLDSTIVVLGPVDLDLPSEAIGVYNPRWREGMATSLQAGIAAAGNDGHDAVVVGLADQPLVPVEAWKAVAAAAHPIAIATYDDRLGHPVLLGRDVWPLLPTSDDIGARELIATRPELVTLVPCPGDPCDIDTIEELRLWS